MRQEKLVRVYEVLYHVADSDRRAFSGAAGDGSFIARFRSAREAEQFAAGREVYGKPATVDAVDVPRRLADRWGV